MKSQKKKKIDWKKVKKKKQSTIQMNSALWGDV
jgi:hypothetical protein